MDKHNKQLSKSTSNREEESKHTITRDVLSKKKTGELDRKIFPQPYNMK